MRTGIVDNIRSYLSSWFGPHSDRPMEAEEPPGKPVELTRPFTLSDKRPMDDPLLREIMEQDLQGMDTPLELMKRYADVLAGELHHGVIDDKLDRLFLCGKTPESLEGFHHGITLSLKTGTDLQKTLEGIWSKLKIPGEVDPLQVLYGRLLSTTSPWAGKNFQKLSETKRDQLTEGFEDGVAYLGINSFRRDNKVFLNNLAGHVLSAVIDMEETPGPDRKQRSWIYAKGGLFIAKKQKSVDPEHPEKEVFGLNYRWKTLGNRFPNRLLIDELVEIADGLFLGKLYYATSLQHIGKDFDPRIPVADYKYRCFGYFLLMDDSWLHEKNRLFPELAYRLADDLPQKFSRLHLVESPESGPIRREAAESKTVLHYLQDLSTGVKEGTEPEQEYFKKMHQLFMCGQRPDGIEGFLHGGVVAFRSSGFLKKLNRNVLNDLWPAVRPFSPWTGKTFTPTSVAGIRKYIGADSRRYEGSEPILLGANTYRKELDPSLAVTAFVERLKHIGMVVEYPDEREKEEDIYVKSFYFIAANSRSISPECAGKEVLQFNYRWPEFHTIPPDHLCIDELVRIADGLYLGQLLYSTNVHLEYNPETPPESYEYENFGYFLLMDDEWWSIKEFISFDTER